MITGYFLLGLKSDGLIMYAFRSYPSDFNVMNSFLGISRYLAATAVFSSSFLISLFLSVDIIEKTGGVRIEL